MASLTSPYHERADEFKKAYDELKEIIEDEITCVAFVVFKDRGPNPRAKKFVPEKWGSKDVLHIYLSEETIDTVLPEMNKGLEAMKRLERNPYVHNPKKKKEAVLVSDFDWENDEEWLIA